MDKPLQEMAKNMGTQRCSDLDVPMFKTVDFAMIATTHFMDLTQCQWGILAKEFIEPGIIRILSSMLFKLLNEVTTVIYNNVAPQVQDRLCSLPAPGPGKMMTEARIESILECNYTSVTEDDIHASIGDSLHFCFGETMLVQQRKTHYSERLTELFVAEVTKAVNRKLSDTISCTSYLTQSAVLPQFDTKDMVYYVSHILSCLIPADFPVPEDSNVKSVFPLSNREAFQISQDSVLSKGFTSVLGQQGSVLSDGGSAELHEDQPSRLGTAKLEEIDSFLNELESTFSGRNDAKAQDDQECLDRETTKGSCPDKTTCVEELNAEDDADTESVPEKEGSAVPGGSDVKVQVCLDGDRSEGSCPGKVTNVEVLSAEDDADTESVPEKEGSAVPDGSDVKVQVCLDGDRSEGSCPEEVTNAEVFNAEDAEDINSIPEQQGSVLTVFLENLLTQIVKAAKTPKSDMDFDGMVERLSKKIAGQLTLQSVENAHIPVCKELCRMFGSADMLQAAVVISEATFIDAVARTLEMQLRMSARKNSSFAAKLKRFFRGRKAKVSSFCEINSTECDNEFINVEKASTTPPQKKQKRPVIVSMFKILCRPFGSCTSSRSQD